MRYVRVGMYEGDTGAICAGRYVRGDMCGAICAGTVVKHFPRERIGIPATHVRAAIQEGCPGRHGLDRLSFGKA